MGDLVLKDIDAVLLAGGRGQRLGSLTDEKPKPLVAVGGKSLLYWNLAQFDRLGVRRLVIVGGYRMSDLMSAAELYAWADSSPEVVWVKQKTPEAEGALLDGLSASQSDRTLVRCADDLLTDETLSALVANLGSGNLLTRRVADSPLARLVIDRGRVVRTSHDQADPIMTHNLCLLTNFALEWTRHAVSESEPLVASISTRLEAGIFAVDGSSSIGINHPADISSAEEWVGDRLDDPS